MTKALRLGLLASAAVLALTLAGCAAPAPDPGDAGGTADGQCSGEAAEGIDLKAAEEIRAPYLATPKELPDLTPLSKPAEEGLRIAYLNLGSPIAGIFWDMLQPVGERLGAKLENIQTGSTAQSINSALNSVVESKPDIVLAIGVDPTFYIDQLDQMKDAGVTFVASSIANAEDFGLSEVIAGRAASIESGRALAASAIALSCGQGTDFAFYTVPEISAFGVQLESAKETLAELCPECTLREVDIPVATMTASGPDTLLSDLQAHPDTDAFITPADELQVGLAQKLELAGLPDIPGVGQSSTPANIQQLAAGEQAEGFVVDLSLFMWLLVDQALRENQGSPIDFSDTDWSTYNASYSTFLDQETAKEYQDGYVAVPGFEDQFAELWQVD